MLEIKEELDGVNDKGERREIIRAFVERKRGDGIEINEEDLWDQLGGPQLPGRPRGKSVDLTDFCPETRIRISSIKQDIAIPSSKEGMLMRNLALTEMTRELVFVEIADAFRRIKKTDGVDRMQPEDLTKILWLAEKVNQNAMRDYDALWKHFKDDVNASEVPEINLADLEEGLQAFIEYYSNNRGSGKKGSRKTDDDILKMAKNVTSHISKNEPELGNIE